MGKSIWGFGVQCLSNTYFVFMLGCFCIAFWDTKSKWTLQAKWGGDSVESGFNSEYPTSLQGHICFKIGTEYISTCVSRGAELLDSRNIVLERWRSNCWNSIFSLLFRHVVFVCCARKNHCFPSRRLRCINNTESFTSLQEEMVSSLV